MRKLRNDDSKNNEDMILINSKEHNAVDNEEKQKYIKEIENILSEIRFSLQQRQLNANELSKIILGINNEARNLEIDNKVLNLVHELIFINSRRDLPLYHDVPLLKILITIILAIIYICDIFANILLSAIYITEKRYSQGITTFGLYILPTIFISTVLKRYFVTYKNKYVICNFSPVICCFETIITASKILSIRKTNDMIRQMKYYNKLRCNYETTDRIKQFVGFLQGAPQLLYQITILIYSYKIGIYVTNLFFQLFLITTSLLIHVVAIETRFKGQILQKLWLFPIVVARILCISILMFKYPSRILICLILHWLITTCWYLKKEKGINQYSQKERILLSASEAVVSTFIPINFMDLDVHLGLCVIHFIENISCNIIWVLTLRKFDNSGYIYGLVIVLNVIYFLFGLSVKIILRKFTKSPNTPNSTESLIR